MNFVLFQENKENIFKNTDSVLIKMIEVLQTSLTVCHIITCTSMCLSTSSPLFKRKAMSSSALNFPDDWGE